MCAGRATEKEASRSDEDRSGNRKRREMDGRRVSERREREGETNFSGMVWHGRVARRGRRIGETEGERDRERVSRRESEVEQIGWRIQTDSYRGQGIISTKPTRPTFHGIDPFLSGRNTNNDGTSMRIDRL